MTGIRHWLKLVAAARAAGAERWSAGDASVHRIAGGFNNALYRVEVDGEAVACKLCVIDERRRAEREYNTLTALQAAGLDVAPRPLGIDESCTVLPYPAVVFFRPSMVSAYLKEHRDTVSPLRRDGLKRLARILFADRPPAELLDRGPVGDDGLPHRFAPDEVVCV